MSSKRRTPKNYQSIVRQYPHFMAALDAVGKAAADAGPLTEKTRHLVQIGAAAAIRSEGAVHSHTRRAHWQQAQRAKRSSTPSSRRPAPSAFRT